MSKDDELLARKDADGNTQTLYDHLRNAARLASSFESHSCDIAGTAALLHDIGKATSAFQNYLIRGEGERGSVIHARQGAFAVDDTSSDSMYAKTAQELLELVISKHHGHLPDCINPISPKQTFFDDFSPENKAKDIFHYDEVKANIPKLGLDIPAAIAESSRDIMQLVAHMQQSGITSDESCHMFLGLYVKYIYSRLIDADRLDAASFEAKRTHSPNRTDWNALIAQFDENIRKLDTTSAINAVRDRVAQECRKAADRPTGIYKLAVPTGGGKTLSSLNFALHHAQLTGKRRIIYVIPYLSITAQTVESFKQILNLDDSDNDILLEHYSSAMSDDSYDQDTENENQAEQLRKLATERWDNPIIVTTMVQFLETVMSAYGTKLRKFHNMANSVIIFDEIQSIPTKTINIFNEIVSFLSSVLGSTILLCSATQPQLEQTNRKNLLLADHPDLISLSAADTATLRRTNIIASTHEKTCDELASIIMDKARKNGNCLAIFNLKSEARTVYQELSAIDRGHAFTLIHLSTAMCGKHRKDQLAKVKKLTRAHQPVICISTQLIEAGVDVSFSCVVRAMAGLDSILQAAGRCNRNGESPSPKDVYVYPVAQEKGLRFLRDIKEGKCLMMQMLKEYPDTDLLSAKMLDEYYRRWFARLDESGGYMDYPMEDGVDTLYELLAYNGTARGNYNNRTGKIYGHVLAQSFKTASDNFHVIPRLTHNVVVMYDDQIAERLNQLNQRDTARPSAILHAMQDYTVSLFDWEYDALRQVGAISTGNAEYAIEILDKAHYDEQYGVVLETEPPLLMY